MTISQTAVNVCDISKESADSPTIFNSSNSNAIYLGHGCTIKPHASLANFTSYRVGGPAEWYVAPRNIDALQASIQYAKAEKLPVTVLGAGSNLLISDRGLPGLVISTRYLRHSHFEEDTGLLTVAAGEAIPSLAWEAAAHGWEGLEWAVGIPGTVGGAVVMNAGAHQGCIADIFVNAEVLTPEGTLKVLTPEDLRHTYRSSALQGSQYIITKATFRLQPGADPVKVNSVTKEHKQHRLSTQPYDKPSCGSVFRNPKPYAAGWLIEQSGLKGFQIGKAQVASRHANFIINCGGASAGDIFSLIRHIQHHVQENWSVCLETEVKMIGEFQAA